MARSPEFLAVQLRHGVGAESRITRSARVAAASEWVTTLPPTYAKDTDISGLVDYLIKQSSDPDPEAAAHWAAASVDPEGRGRRLQRVGEAWFKRDPAGAAAAIEASTLPADVKQTLLNHASAK